MKAADMYSIVAGIQSFGRNHRPNVGLRYILLVMGLLAVGASVFAQQQSSDLLAHRGSPRSIRYSGDKLKKSKSVHCRDVTMGLRKKHAATVGMYAENFEDAFRLTGIQDAMKSVQCGNVSNAIRNTGHFQHFDCGQNVETVRAIAGIQDAKRSVKGGHVHGATQTIAANIESEFTLFGAGEMAEAFYGVN